MPKTQRPSKAALARLSRLPRRPDLVIEGGKRTVDVFIREGKQTIKPQVAIWVDAQSGYVRGTAMINPLDSADDGVGEALNALVESVTNPLSAPPAPSPTLIELPPGRGKTATARPPIGLPAKIVVNDAALAGEAAAIFSPLDVPVERSGDLPAFESAFESLTAYLGADPNAAPPEEFSWQIDAALLPALYKAAAGYAKRAPWTYMPDHPPLAVRLGENGPAPGVETLYASIMGAAGQVNGVAFYYSQDDFWQAISRGTNMVADDQDVDTAIAMLRQSGAPVDMVPPDELHDMVGGLMVQMGMGAPENPELFENCLVVFLEEKDECDPTYLEWLAEHKIAYTRHNIPMFLRTAQGGTPRPPDEREVRALTAALDAVDHFFKQHQRVLKGPFLPPDGLTAEGHDSAGKVAFEVRFPPADYDWDKDEEYFGEEDWEEDDEDDEEVDEPERPASPSGQTTLYRFQVKLEWRKSVWRRIELRGDQTLHDLHGAIQAAFDWDDDHLYAFFLSGKAWDEASEYESPFGEGRSASRYRLEHLPLRAGQRFLYIFDFGDELRHLVTLEAITPGGVQAGVEYPRVTESHGASVPQYTEWE